MIFKAWFLFGNFEINDLFNSHNNYLIRTLEIRLSYI